MSFLAQAAETTYLPYWVNFGAVGVFFILLLTDQVFTKGYVKALLIQISDKDRQITEWKNLALSNLQLAEHSVVAAEKTSDMAQQTLRLEKIEATIASLAVVATQKKRVR